MLFNSFNFLIFFAVFCAFYFSATQQRVRLWIVLLFSNVFYGWWSWKYLTLIWFTIFVDYTLAKMISESESLYVRKRLLWASVGCNLGVLAIFKYFNFFVSGFEAAGVDGAAQWYIKNLVLPAGLSFYTFQSISYTFDVYRRKQKAIQSLLEYSAFVCYFPQLVAGPIERAGHLIPMILAPVALTRERMSSGVLLFCLGFFRKSFADVLAQLVEPVFGDVVKAAPAAVVLSIFGFGLQIYLDFSGYSDMARGVSKVMGVDLMINFKAPYLSRSPREFWTRWHISLSQWLRDYLYISLGGNRVGEWRQLMNLMITMLLGGLWHGAGINFIIWGALHGAYLCINHMWLKVSARFSILMDKFKYVFMGVSWLLTWIAVNYAWLYFRCSKFETVVAANHKIVQWLAKPELPAVAHGFAVLLLVVILIDAANRYFEIHPVQKPTSRFLWTQDIVAGLLFTLGFILSIGTPTQQFIYFSF